MGRVRVGRIDAEGVTVSVSRRAFVPSHTCPPSAPGSSESVLDEEAFWQEGSVDEQICYKGGVPDFMPVPAGLNGIGPERLRTGWEVRRIGHPRRGHAMQHSCLPADICAYVKSVHENAAKAKEPLSAR